MLANGSNAKKHYRIPAKRRNQAATGAQIHHCLTQTSKGNRPENDPRENPENQVNEYQIPTKCLKRIIRYETPAKL